MPSGDLPPNPSELLGAERMGQLMKELSEKYDWIFADLPPTLAVSDAASLSKYLAGMVLVVRAGRTKREDAKRALERLELAGAEMLGLVLNGAPRAGSNSNDGYGYTSKSFVTAAP
jgi:capsular exopolysaccharide synthesis family protein